MYQHILLDIKDDIATLTFNRPDKLNAYIVEMGEEVVDAFAAMRNDDNVKVIIITGAGRGFCAGVDLEHLKAQMERGADSSVPQIGQERFVTELPMEMATYPKPVIAAINGHAIGVGVTFSLACDIRIASEKAKLGVTFAKLGMVPGLGSTQLLPQIVGAAKARELMLTAKVILGPEAAEIGLVNKVVPEDKVMEEALIMAKQIAGCKPHSLAAIKELLHKNESVTLSEAMDNERSFAKK